MAGNRMTQHNREPITQKTPPVGQHWTIQTIVEGRDGNFGFCINDDGEQGYISRAITKKYDITYEHEGQGFTAPAREPAVMTKPYSPQITMPLVWDEEVDDKELDNMLTQLDVAAGATDNLMVVLRKFRKVQLDMNTKGSTHNIDDVVALLENEVAVLTKVGLWLDENYPESSD